MLAGQVMAERRHLTDKAELSALVRKGRGGGMAHAVVERHVGQIGNGSAEGHRECHLDILAAEILVAEQVGVVLISLAEHRGTIERGAEVETAHVSLRQYGFQQFTARGDGLVLTLLAGARLSRGLIEELPVGDYHRHLGVLLHHAEFLFQFQRVCPEVIACTVGYIRSASGEQTVEIVVDDALVMLVADEPDGVGIAAGIVFADSTRAISGTILADNDLQRHVALLAEYRVERPADGGLLVVGGNDYGDHLFHHRSRLRWGRVMSRNLRPFSLLTIRRNQVYFAL